MWLDGRTVGLVVGRKEASTIKEEQAHDKSAFFLPPSGVVSAWNFNLTIDVSVMYGTGWPLFS